MNPVSDVTTVSVFRRMRHVARHTQPRMVVSVMHIDSPVRPDRRDLARIIRLAWGCRRSIARRSIAS
jgi:hypothetical protein